MTHFFTFVYSLAAFAFCFSALVLYQITLTIGPSSLFLLPSPALTLKRAGYSFNLNRTLRTISDREARGQSLVSWPDVGFYTSSDKDVVFSNAFPILGSPPPLPVYDVEPTTDSRTRKDEILFDLDLAKALVVLCGLVCPSLSSLSLMVEELTKGGR